MHTYWIGFVALAALSSPVTAATKKCYYLDGSSTDNSFAPCRPDDDNSACCASNKTNGDICLASGLCYAQDGPFNGLIYANGCTDKSGKSASCVNICPDTFVNSAVGRKARVYNILPCNPGQFCCRASDDKRNCCSNAEAMIKRDIGKLMIPDAPTTSANPSATSSSSQGTQAKQPLSSGSSTDTPTECPQDNTAVVGGAVGGTLGVALLASLVAIAFLLKRRPKPVPEYNGIGNGSEPKYQTELETPRQHTAYELAGQDQH